MILIVTCNNINDNHDAYDDINNNDDNDNDNNNENISTHINIRYI